MARSVGCGASHRWSGVELRGERPVLWRAEKVESPTEICLEVVLLCMYSNFFHSNKKKTDEKRKGKEKRGGVGKGMDRHGWAHISGVLAKLGFVVTKAQVPLYDARIRDKHISNPTHLQRRVNPGGQSRCGAVRIPIRISAHVPAVSREKSWGRAEQAACSEETTRPWPLSL
ncbi:hypothetical protein L249_2445 [Ophiocordyceps polyrhachis-furcata BCC 54312]|uniref:Uncharacterized protein n=1 Tax=Ophiocordyceps polyrhachis-furcata BCC 54312 TaxID=1330021 RepID=A0A367LS09_9HYPO|nr:hypothetical protein L249_2445 [Ophiocordyceps polyrhachis-furcata BCC 54312]